MLGFVKRATTLAKPKALISIKDFQRSNKECQTQILLKTQWY